MKKILFITVILLTISYSFYAASMEDLLENGPMFTTCQVDQGSTQSIGASYPLKQVLEAWRTHYSYAWYKPSDQVNLWHIIRNNEAVIKQILQMEAENAQTYDIAYRGTNKFRLVSDTIEILYEAIHGPLPPDFVLLRDPLDPEIGNETAWEWLDKHWVTKVDLATMRDFLDWLEIKPAADHTSQLFSDDDVEMLWWVLWHFQGDTLPKEALEVIEKTQDPLMTLRRQGPAEWALFYQSIPDNLGEADTQLALYKEKLYNTMPSSIKTLLENQGRSKWDHDYDHAKRFLAVNYGLFSLCFQETAGIFTPDLGECTLIYWLIHGIEASHIGNGHWDKIKNSLIPILVRYGIPDSEVDQLIRIYQEHLQPEDDRRLFQILIPKKASDSSTDQPLVNSLMYNCYPYGYIQYYPPMKDTSKVLRTYREDPSQLFDHKKLEGRLIMSQQSLDPKSGIRWLTYLPEGGSHERIETYRQALRDWAATWIRN